MGPTRAELPLANGVCHLRLCAEHTTLWPVSFPQTGTRDWGKERRYNGGRQSCGPDVLHTGPGQRLLSPVRRSGHPWASGVRKATPGLREKGQETQLDVCVGRSHTRKANTSGFS